MSRWAEGVSVEAMDDRKNGYDPCNTTAPESGLATGAKQVSRLPNPPGWANQRNTELIGRETPQTGRPRPA